MGRPVQAGQAGRQGPVASGADDLHPNGTDTIVLIHGLWVTALIWEQWIARYRARGYRVLTPGWPGLRRHAHAGKLAGRVACFHLSGDQPDDRFSRRLAGRPGSG